MKTLFSFN